MYERIWCPINAHGYQEVAKESANSVAENQLFQNLALPGPINHNAVPHGNKCGIWSSHNIPRNFGLVKFVKKSHF